MAEQSAHHHEAGAQQEHLAGHQPAAAPEQPVKQKRVPKKRMRLAESETTAGQPEHTDADGEVGTANGVAEAVAGGVAKPAAAAAAELRRVGPARSLEVCSWRLPGSRMQVAEDVHAVVMGWHMNHSGSCERRAARLGPLTRKSPDLQGLGTWYLMLCMHVCDLVWHR